MNTIPADPTNRILFLQHNDVKRLDATIKDTFESLKRVNKVSANTDNIQATKEWAAKAKFRISQRFHNEKAKYFDLMGEEWQDRGDAHKDNDEYWWGWTEATGET